MPRGREKNITGQGKDVFKRGEDLGTGPVGKEDGYEGRPMGSPRAKNEHSSSLDKRTGTSEKGETFRRMSGGQETRSFQPGGSQTRGAQTRGIFGGRLIRYIIIAVVIYFVISFIFGGGGGNDPTPTPTPSPVPSGNQEIEIPFDHQTVTSNISSSTTSAGWSILNNSGKLDTSVASGARDKYTKIKGNGNDTVTVMVYMCGADLESRSGLGTSDLVEMIEATMNDKVNVVVYCGGTTRWQNDVLNSRTNQIILIKDGGIAFLSQDEGNVAMTKPSTLSGFIKYCAKNFEANRYELIFWDHGAGTLSGYGYDEKFTSSGTMTLSGINQALKDGGVKFDFVGFDACLMATAETGLMLSNYADYMIASEEVEAGYGWYYTNWLTSLAKNTSTPTVQIGKEIVDDFIATCAKQVPGQKATLSVVDLAELSATMPKELKDFATTTQALIKENYNTVATARSSTREFSTQSIDQVDLVNLALNMKTEEGRALADAVLGAVKYNKVSSNMTNAYGLSIYFPYKKASGVKTAVSTYEAIGMEDEYSRCIQAFAGVTSSGQNVQQNVYPQYTGGGSSIFDLFEEYNQGSSSSQGSTGYMSEEDMEELIGTLLESLLSDRSVISTKEVASIVRNNVFDASKLIWTKSDKGNVISLSGNNWSVVRDLCLNMFYDDGAGYIDLGLDNIYDITEDGQLVADEEGTWLAINQQPIAYYYIDSIDDGTDYIIFGRVPALLNGDRVNLILEYRNGTWTVAGANFDYSQTEGVEAIAKNLVEIKDGDTIDFICDYYSYDGKYESTHMLGDRLTVNGQLMVSDVYLPRPDAINEAYIFTDIYGQEYWTPVVPR